MLIAIAAIPIFIIGAETLLLYVLARMRRFAMKYSKFNDVIQFKLLKNTVLFFVIVLVSCGNRASTQNSNELIIGANRLSVYLPLLKGKNIGIVANQTSVIFNSSLDLKQSHHQFQKPYTHLVDSLLNLGVKIKKVFAPEHGYRGLADAGEYVKNGIDLKTGVPIVSMYGTSRKPNPEDLKDLDVIIFDVQDVGARFYTFTSTLHYMMEACANLKISLIVLDRPNPNGHYVDGPILDLKYRSFVGMHPVPIVHGMTVGEYASMINGERWLDQGVQCNLQVIPMVNYKRTMRYNLPVLPSPNLPNSMAVNLYPSLCLFEGTNVSVGRGTDKQFQIFGSPYLDHKIFDFEFIPTPKAGAKQPKHNNILCHGQSLKNTNFLEGIQLEWLIKAYNNTSDPNSFFNSFFTKLAGTTKLQKQIESGWSSESIKNSWAKDLDSFKSIRSNYLLYR